MTCIPFGAIERIIIESNEAGLRDSNHIIEGLGVGHRIGKNSYLRVRNQEIIHNPNAQKVLDEPVKVA